MERQRKETLDDLKWAFLSSYIRIPSVIFHVSDGKLSELLNTSARGEGSKAFTTISQFNSFY